MDYYVKKLTVSMTTEADMGMKMDLELPRHGQPDKFSKFRQEIDCHTGALSLAAEEDKLWKDEPELTYHRKQYRDENSSSTIKQMNKYIKAEWRPNITMLDVEYEYIAEHSWSVDRIQCLSSSC
jgi:hypothetical protein